MFEERRRSEGNGALKLAGGIRYEAKQILVSRLLNDLERCLEGRFPCYWTYADYAYDKTCGGALNGKPGYLLLRSEKDAGLRLANAATSATALELKLSPRSLVQAQGELTLSSYSDETIVKFAARFIKGYLNARDESEREVDALALHMPRDGDVLLDVDKPFSEWCTHPRGILLLREDGAYLNEEKIIDGGLGKSFRRLETIPKGIVYESAQVPADVLKLVMLGLDGSESVLYNGKRDNVVMWRAHPQGVALQIGNEIHVNGDTCIFQGELSEGGWCLTSSGRVITVADSEHSDRRLPDGSGCFLPAHYYTFYLEGEKELYEVKYEFLNPSGEDWLPHADIYPTAFGLIIKDSPEWRFYQRYEAWQRDEEAGGDKSFGDEWSFFEVSPEEPLKEGMRLDDREPEAAHLIWRPGWARFFQWYPSVEGGKVNGIVVREEGRAGDSSCSFVFHSDLISYSYLDR